MNILLATDGSHHSRRALDLLKQAPLISPESDVSVLVVVPAGESAIQDSLRREAKNLAQLEAERLKDTGCVVRAICREGHVADSIVEAADRLGTDLVVVGSRGVSDAERFLLGSVSQKTMKYARCSVLVTRPRENEALANGDGQGKPFRILVAFDGSKYAQAAVDQVAALSLPDRAEVTIVTVLPLIKHFRTDIVQTASPEWHHRKRKARESLDAAANVVRGAASRVDTTLREGGNEADEILKVAEELDTDLIVLGHKGKSAIERFLLGSVSHRLAHHAGCSVWLVKISSRAARRD